jgi:hypothetical protein
MGMISKNSKNITILVCLRMDSNMVDLSEDKKKGELSFAFVRVVGADGLEPPTYAL